MKIRNLVLLTLSAASLNLYAYEGRGFKIIDEKITSSKNSHGGIVSLPILYSLGSTASGAMVSDKAGKPNQFVRLDSDHSLSIRNNNLEVKSYTYKYFLTCGDFNQSFERTLSIEPNGYFDDHAQIFGNVQKALVGNYKITATTWINGSEFNKSESNATLRISN